MLIVGIDAGATAAFAVVDFDGNVVRFGSGKAWGEDELSKRIAPFEPQIIACDTRPANKLAQKLKAVFSARLYSPPRSLAVLEKQLMTRGYAVKNSHERDALAAALKAFHSVENQLRKTQRRARERGRVEEVQRLRREVLRGKRLHDFL